VNTTTSSYQSYGNDGNYAPNVAVLSDGDFVVVWPSYSQDGSTWAVMGQRFDAAGNKWGANSRSTKPSPAASTFPTSSALSSGGFVVTFYNDNYDRMAPARRATSTCANSTPAATRSTASGA
jgi:hypothetical protein